MLSIFSALGSLFSLLGSVLKGIFTLEIFRQGEKTQAAADQTATLDAVEREEVAAAKPQDTNDRLQKGNF